MANLKPVICGVILLDDRNRELLHKRDNKSVAFKSGDWVFPGEHLDQDEAPENRVRREMAEKTDYQCADLDWLISLPDYHDPQAPALLHLYARNFDGEQCLSCREGFCVEFVTFQAASKRLVPYYLRILWALTIQLRRFRSLLHSYRANYN